MSISIENLLADKDSVRLPARRALANASASERAPLLAPLLEALQQRVGADDPDEPWTYAADALLLLDVPAGSEAVHALVRHEEPSVRAALVELFAELGPLPPPVAALADDEEEEVRSSVFSNLARQPVPGLAETVRTHAQQPDAGEDALKALGACARVGSHDDRAKADAVLAEALDATDDARREGAIGAFSYLRSASPEARAKLRALTTAERPQTKYPAIGALAAVGDDTDARLDLLIETGAKGQSLDADVAMLFLGNMDPGQVVPAYERAMTHARPVVRAFAVTGATAHPNKRARVDVGKVEALLADSDGEVRAGAANAAAKLGEHKTRLLPKLQALLEDKSKVVKSAAKKAIASLERA